MVKTCRRSKALMAALCSTLCTTSCSGFISSSVGIGPLNNNNVNIGVVPQFTTELHAVASQKLRTKNARPLTSINMPRLTADEEKDLLRQTVEMRRLTQLEQEMAFKSPSKSLPLLSVRTKAAGYGTELDLYEDALLDGQRARDTLVTRNMGLVHFTINNVIGKAGTGGARLNSLSRDDLVQEGAIGLARAVDKWNPSIGGRFSTYATYWIRASVLRCIAERDDVVRVPNHVSAAIREINRAARTLGIDINSNLQSVNWKEAETARLLAETAGLSEGQLAHAMKARSRRYSGGYVPFEAWMQQGKDLTTDTPADQYAGMSANDKEHLQQTLSQFLRPKEMEALSWRYGLIRSTVASDNKNYLEQAEKDLFGSKVAKKTKPKRAKRVSHGGRWGEAMTFTEVGKQMHVSAEYGRRLCHAALNKLRSAAEDGRLEPSLLV